jgi:hypothetical protein
MSCLRSGLVGFDVVGEIIESLLGSEGPSEITLFLFPASIQIE